MCAGRVIDPLPSNDPAWRGKARSWLAVAGVNNQGRVRSDNIASRECDGLRFLSEPEILLYKALKRVSVSFAPLAVFLRGGHTSQRIGPDFLNIREGMVMIVEVDGDTVHPETPDEAHARTTMLVHASQCDTPETATAYADYFLRLFDQIKASR